MCYDWDAPTEVLRPRCSNEDTEMLRTEAHSGAQWAIAEWASFISKWKGVNYVRENHCWLGSKAIEILSIGEHLNFAWWWAHESPGQENSLPNATDGSCEGRCVLATGNLARTRVAALDVWISQYKRFIKSASQRHPHVDATNYDTACLAVFVVNLFIWV